MFSTMVTHHSIRDEEEKNCWIKSLFYFSLRTKSKWKDQINCTEQWRDQIATSVEWEACTLYNAANMSAVWKHLKCLRKMQKLLQAPTARDSLVLHRMSSRKRRRGGCCCLPYDDWNREMALVNKLQNVMFSNTNCMYSDSTAQTLGDISLLTLSY